VVDAVVDGPLSLVLLLLLLRRDPVADAQPTIERPPEAGMSTENVLLRLSAVEDRIGLLHQEVVAIRTVLQIRTTAAAPTVGTKPAPAPPRPAPAAAPAPLPRPLRRRRRARSTGVHSSARRRSLGWAGS
jgi:hypothetical protein